MSETRLGRGPAVTHRVESNACTKGISDCMYRSGGNCAAESCVYDELPTMNGGGRTLTCSVCGQTSKTFSVYSGVTSFVCDSCKEKIKKVTTDRKCPICGASISLEQTMCSSCASRIKGKLNE